MEEISLDERPEGRFVRSLMILFGIICIFTAGWWALYLIRNPMGINIYWIATLFLLLFGAYQIYAGLGHARRYIAIDGNNLIIRQNPLARPKILPAGKIEDIEIRKMDIVFTWDNDQRYRLKLGMRYPGIREKVREAVDKFAVDKKINHEYSYD
ncbi:MAG: hypothetical protein ABR519_03175 [Bacteroidales bacterium]